ncbi:flavin-containing monooxygenase FMO GS-OX-like 4 [Prunus yedoensis var. nudiflora]|uniref:Flavin-containing monooxygenase n=1 Tax=Prunus yedoensis var. nudiflora TaxID=2094558 RepID=A0A314YBR6_PRUYE|nr:flavin-containing monooxygenase FMO GS-OX-like 4 [Prunus yedoensis var. nudiflora]
MQLALNPLASRQVAVIGAGAGGLVAARELGEKATKSWSLSEETKWVARGSTLEGRIRPTWAPPGSDHGPLEHVPVTPDEPPERVHGFQGLPICGQRRRRRERPEKVSGSQRGVEVRDGGDGVDSVEGGKWKVKSKSKGGDGVDDEIYDAVVVCNGHYTEPVLLKSQVSIHGKESNFTAIITAIQNHFEIRTRLIGYIILIITGGAASSADISRELAGVAKEVHIASRSVADEAFGKQPGYDNMWLHSMIKSAHDDGSVAFQDGSVVVADIILHCTGYKYHFPFLETNGIVTVDDNRVGPLYKHVFPPALAPSLSFVGLPWKVVPFPEFELQSKWIAGLLSNRIALPSKEEMMEDIKAFYSLLEASGIPKRYTHNLGDCQFEYNDWLAALCGCPSPKNGERKCTWKFQRIGMPDQRLIGMSGKMTI